MAPTRPARDVYREFPAQPPSPPLLKRVELTDGEGWVFLRNPDHWYLSNIPRGALLVERPGRDPGDPRPWQMVRWSVMWPAGRGRWKSWCGVPAHIAADFFRIDRVAREPRYWVALHLLSDTRRCTPWYLEEPAPTIGADEGDVIVLARDVECRPAYFRGRVRELELDDYEALRANAHRLQVSNIRPGPASRGGSLLEFLRDRKQWGRRLKQWYSRLILVKPFTETVSQPITATSDDRAIYELIVRCGGRLDPA